MSVATSVISSTDLELFKTLANPFKVDLQSASTSKVQGPIDLPPTTINGGRESPEVDRASRSRSPSRHSRPVSPPSSTSSARRPRGSFPRRPRHRGDPDRPSYRGADDHSRSARGNRRERKGSPGGDRPASRGHDGYDDYDYNRAQAFHGPSSSSSPQPRYRDPAPPPLTFFEPSSFDETNQVGSGPSFNPFEALRSRPPSTSPPRPTPSRDTPAPRPAPATSLFDRETQRFLARDDQSSPRHTHQAPSSRRVTPPIPLFRDDPSSPFQASFPRRSHSPSRHSTSRHSPSRHSTSRHSPSRHSTSRSHPRHSQSKSHPHRPSSRQRRSPSRVSREDEATQQEKRRYLLELEKLKLQGLKLTRDYSLSDPLADIRFEHDTHRANYDVVDSVNFMKDILGVSFTVIETLNQRFGPILQLRGWAAYMQKNMGRFDRLLERAYHRFWRHGQPSPFMEFGWLVFGSMIMWHLQNKYLGGLPVGDMMGMMGGSSGSSGGGGASASGANIAAAAPGFSLGNILRMFTGGGTANRPPPPSQAPPAGRPPSIIPPLPSQVPATGPLSSSTLPTTARPVPPSGTAPTLPLVTNPAAAASTAPPRAAVLPARRLLRRPSAHLQAADRPPLSPISEARDDQGLPPPSG